MKKYLPQTSYSRGIVPILMSSIEVEDNRQDLDAILDVNDLLILKKPLTNKEHVVCTLLKTGYNQIDISNILNISKQRINNIITKQVRPKIVR